MSTFLDTLAGLSATEEFLDFLGVAYDPAVVNVNRLHILKRFHDYAGQSGLPGGLGEGELADGYARALRRAYADFVESTPHREKVFKVFQDAADRAAFVPLAALKRK